MTKTMYDAIDPNSIPTTVPPPDYCMGYIDGQWPSYVAMKARFPNAIPVAISAIPNSSNALWAQGCDGERYDYAPGQAAQFARAKLNMALTPFIYCSLSDWPSYQQALIDIGIATTAVDWLIAAYPGNGANIYPGSVGHQWIDRGTYDESVVIDGWQPGRYISQPIPIGDLMPCSAPISFNNMQHVFQCSGGVLWHKYYKAGRWENEVVAGPTPPTASTAVVTVANQQPQVSLIGNQMLVTVEATNAYVYYFAQGTSGGWGVNELP